MAHGAQTLICSFTVAGDSPCYDLDSINAPFSAIFASEACTDWGEAGQDGAGLPQCTVHKVQNIRRATRNASTFEPCASLISSPNATVNQVQAVDAIGPGLAYSKSNQ